MEDILESLSERDRRVVRESGYEEEGASSWDSRSVGRTPAVLVIDMQQYIVGERVPIFDAIQSHQLAMGDVAWEAIDHIVPVIDTARDNDVPVLYTRMQPPDTGISEEALEIVEPLAPHSDDPVIDKAYTSGFYGTTLGSSLVRHGVDTVVIVGNVTSGCVRATAVDAVQHGYHVVIPRECVFDRLEVSHRVALLELWMKYASVHSRTRVARYLEEPERGLGE